MAKKVNQRIQDITAAPTLKDLIDIPSTGCHLLTGNLKNCFAVEVSGNHRIVFEINHDPIPITSNGEIDVAKVTDINILSIAIDYH